MAVVYLPDTKATISALSRLRLPRTCANTVVIISVYLFICIPQSFLSFYSWLFVFALLFADDKSVFNPLSLFLIIFTPNRNRPPLTKGQNNSGWALTRVLVDRHTCIPEEPGQVVYAFILAVLHYSAVQFVNSHIRDLSRTNVLIWSVIPISTRHIRIHPSLSAHKYTHKHPIYKTHHNNFAHYAIKSQSAKK